MLILRLFVLILIVASLSACVTSKPSVVRPKKMGSGPFVQLSDTELGKQYLLGLSVARDNERAFFHFKRAADHGDVFAQNEVAYLYAAGKGVQQDYPKALQYYQKAADQGLASAEYNVGFFYWHGLGVSANADIARTWLQKSAHHGFEPAVILLRDVKETT